MRPIVAAPGASTKSSTAWRTESARTSAIVSWENASASALVIGRAVMNQLSRLGDWLFLPKFLASDDPLLPSTLRKGSRSEEHTSELQSLMSSSYAVFCLKKKS